MATAFISIYKADLDIRCGYVYHCNDFKKKYYEEYKSFCNEPGSLYESEEITGEYIDVE